MVNQKPPVSPIPKPPANLYVLVDYLLTTEPQSIANPALNHQTEAVCMNPTRECEDCIFLTSRWCLPKEREAKGALKQGVAA